MEGLQTGLACDTEKTSSTGRGRLRVPCFSASPTPHRTALCSAGHPGVPQPPADGTEAVPGGSRDAPILGLCPVPGRGHGPGPLALRFKGRIAKLCLQGKEWGLQSGTHYARGDWWLLSCNQRGLSGASTPASGTVLGSRGQH